MFLLLLFPLLCWHVQLHHFDLIFKLINACQDVSGALWLRPLLDFYVLRVRGQAPGIVDHLITEFYVQELALDFDRVCVFLNLGLAYPEL